MQIKSLFVSCLRLLAPVVCFVKSLEHADPRFKRELLLIVPQEFDIELVKHPNIARSSHKGVCFQQYNL